MTKAVIHITPRAGLLDPQGKAIAGALKSMGFGEVSDARQGKIIEIAIDGPADKARLQQMCEQLLANPVMEDFSIHVENA